MTPLFGRPFDMKIAIVAFALLVTSCISPQQRSARELADLQKDLQLSIRPSSDVVRANSTLNIEFTIQNICNEGRTVCLSDGRAVHLIGIDRSYVRGIHIVIVDHPFCVKRIVLQPSEKFQWTEAVNIGDTPPGAARILVAAQIISTANCDFYGCDDVDLNASYKPLIVEPAR